MELDTAREALARIKSIDWSSATTRQLELVLTGLERAALPLATWHEGDCGTEACRHLVAAVRAEVELSLATPLLAPTSAAVLIGRVSAVLSLLADHMERRRDVPLL